MHRPRHPRPQLLGQTKARKTDISSYKNTCREYERNPRKSRDFTWEITPTHLSKNAPDVRLRRPESLEIQGTMSKRSASPPPTQGTLIKRSRSSEPQNASQLIISSSGKEREQALIRTVKRTSNLEAPIVSLSGAHGVSFCPLEGAVVLVANHCIREKS